MGGSLRPRPSHGAARPADPGGAGRRHEEVHLPGAEAAEEDRGPAVELRFRVQDLVIN